MAKLMRHSFGFVALIAAVGVLALAPAANAGTAGSTYEPKGDRLGEVQGGAKAEAAPAGLPFTGLDVTLILGGGLVLVATGAGLGRLAAHRNE
jgi:hypothetical protein